MKRSYVMAMICVAFAASMHFAYAGSTFSIKLPYPKGQSFVVTQGYDTPPTHINKDSYALDLTQNGCDAYGMPVVAAAPGTAMFLSQEGYNGGYGTELIIDHGNNIVSRYAHMVPGSITVAAKGGAITQGQTIGLVGDTGLVAGTACRAHPGAHLHFAMDTVESDGTFSAYDPEPISGYTGMTVGKWYLSDNGTTTPTASVTKTTNTSSVTIVFSGGSSVPVPEDNSTSNGSDNDVSGSNATPQIETLFEQPDDSTNSAYSSYDDNWFELGNGFSGTLTALTLEGMVSAPDYFASHVALQEFKDKDYTALVAEFPISENAPFTHTMATTTLSGLSIVLKPYFYYRLKTIQDYQNRSVILAGTASTTVGIAMADNFVYGTGGVETTSTFFPFMMMEGMAATSTFVQPPLTTPGSITEDFDSFNMQLTLVWSTSTDPDWPGNPLHYQMNYSTSTSLSDGSWTSPSPFPVATGSAYLIGIRAVDDYGDISASATTTWNFPSDFVPYTLSPELSYAYQYFTVPVTSTLQSITLFTANFETGARNPSGPWCTLDLFDEGDLSSLGDTPADNIYNGYSCGGTPTFFFASSSPTLYPDHQYHWIFTAQTGNGLTAADVQFYGTATNTASGTFSDPSLVNAKFILNGNGGVIFGN